VCFQCRDLTFRSYTPTDENLKKHVNLATPSQIQTTAETETKDIPVQTLKEAAEKETEEVVSIEKEGDPREYSTCVWFL
jgi:outer membrane lipopolysaccharide assembly protein LptE/RlpB